MKSNAREMTTEEIMQRIRQEAVRRKRANLSEEIPRDRSVTPEISKTTTITNETAANTRIDRFLWKYGMRYAKIVNKIPVLKIIAEKQYLRLTLGKTYADTSAVPPHLNDGGLNFLGINWYYHDFFEQTKKEGLRGKIKLFILRYIGFYAWWQGEINRVIYSELNRQKLILDLLNQEMESMRDGFDERQRDLFNREIERIRCELSERDRTIEDMNNKLILLDGSVDAFSQEIRNQGGDIEEMKSRLVLLDGSVDAFSREIRNQGGDISKQAEKLRGFRLSLLDQQQTLAVLLEEVRKRLTKPLVPVEIENIIKEEDHLLDALYATFGDQFRGTKEEIKAKQRIYLPYIEEAKAGTEEAPILDLGCGRGEWLELLRENRYVAEGVDSNRVLVQQCHGLGFNVTEADVIGFLRKQLSNSFGAITGFHLIEHLSLRDLIALLDESRRVLKPGGLVIFETPNPTNLFVSTYDFYRDPSHIRPVHPDTINFLLEMRGFVRIGSYFIEGTPPFRMTPSTDWNLDDLDGYLAASRDFASIGYKG